MIITSDRVGMSSSRTYSQSMSQSYKTSKRFNGNAFANVTKHALTDSYTSKEQYDSYTGSNFNRNGADCDTFSSRDEFADTISSSQNYLNGTFTYSNMKASNFRATEVTSNVPTTFADFRQRAFYSLWNLIQNFKLRSMFNDSNYAGGLPNANGETLVMSSSSNTVSWSVSTSYSSVYTEKETTAFSTTGTVSTADGRTIDFNMNLEMSREYMEKNELSYLKEYTTVLTDPLVINLTDAPVSISDQTFLFDIDGDGKKEEHASLNSGSAFLALDKNNDGIINDGSELFGTKSGNGFADLAAYDADKNGWIDEADQIYRDLKVWTKDENGKDILMSLKDADVGAICLSSSKTDFSVRDDANTTKAQVRRTGFYLHENGIAGSMQQIDI